jgi:glutaconate CoA-transferase subunit B
VAAGTADHLRLEVAGQRGIAMSADYSLPEMMVVQAAREIAGARHAFIGMGLPMLATAVAKALHDPSLAYSTEVGVADWSPRDGDWERAPTGIADPILNRDAAYIGDMVDALGAWLMGGRFGVAVLTAAEIDRYGNLNTLLIGDPARPTVRLPGTGGNTDAACVARRVITIMSLEPRRFVERVSFLASPGYIDGPGGRRRAGLQPQGPNVLVSTMGVFGFDTPDGGASGSCEMVLTKTFPGIPADAVGAMIPWPLRMEVTEECSAPTERELQLVRALDDGPTYLRPGRY